MAETAFSTKGDLPERRSQAQLEEAAHGLASYRCKGCKRWLPATAYTPQSDGEWSRLCAECNSSRSLRRVMQKVNRQLRLQRQLDAYKDATS